MLYCPAPDSLDDFHPTVPQLGGDHGGCIAQPTWMRNTNKNTLVMDTRDVSGTAFAFLP